MDSRSDIKAGLRLGLAVASAIPTWLLILILYGLMGRIFFPASTTTLAQPVTLHFIRSSFYFVSTFSVVLAGGLIALPSHQSKVAFFLLFLGVIASMLFELLPGVSLMLRILLGATGGLVAFLFIKKRMSNQPLERTG